MKNKSKQQHQAAPYTGSGVLGGRIIIALTVTAVCLVVVTLGVTGCTHRENQASIVAPDYSVPIDTLNDTFCPAEIRGVNIQLLEETLWALIDSTPTLDK
ncbi:MAG: hypothetical protein D6800_01115 [Candidatus Zixiibacteriota bacterium]|nr:MAG: hypothetical protein D6800_01115 [candidate division Zixibacteria bacterium]